MPYCEVVLAHSSSNGSSTTIESLSIDPGYWRATATSENVLACYNLDACEGGVTGASNYCHKGYEGSCELFSRLRPTHHIHEESGHFIHNVTFKVATGCIKYTPLPNLLGGKVPSDILP